MLDSIDDFENSPKPKGFHKKRKVDIKRIAKMLLAEAPPKEIKVELCVSDSKIAKFRINILLPLTRCYGTNTMWIESEPYKLDFQPLEGDYGNFWTNNGNVCMHGNKPNVSSVTRMSFDFRIIPLSKYNPN